MHELLHREMRELGALGIALVVVCDLALEQLSTCQHRRGAHPNIIEALSPQQHRENAVESTRLRRLRPLRRMGEAKRSPGRRSTPRHALACDGCECAPQPPRSAGTPAPRHRCQGPGGMARCWAQPRVPRSACSQHGSPAHTDGRQRGDDAQAQGMRPGAVFWLQCPAGDSEAGRPASSAAQLSHRHALLRTHARTQGGQAGRLGGTFSRMAAVVEMVVAPRSGPSEVRELPSTASSSSISREGRGVPTSRSSLILACRLQRAGGR